MLDELKLIINYIELYNKIIIIALNKKMLMKL